MPMLKKPRHEAFDRGVANGLSLKQAYIKADYKPKGARQAASRLLGTNFDIPVRILEIKKEISMRVQGLTKLMLKRQWRELTPQELELWRQLSGESPFPATLGTPDPAKV